MTTPKSERAAHECLKRDDESTMDWWARVPLGVCNCAESSSVAVKPELCVCGHEDADHIPSLNRHPEHDCFACCAENLVSLANSAGPEGVAVDGRPLDLKSGEFYRSGWVQVPVLSVPGMKVTMVGEGYVNAELPHQGQKDWPDAFPFTTTGTVMLPDGGEVVLSYTGIANIKDLKDPKPARPNEPLKDCPGSCTEPSYAHRGNVVCSSDESRRLIE